MNLFDVDEAIGYVNKIIDNVRCAACDRLGGLYLRYPCGHRACDKCVIYAEDCQTCTPPHTASEPKPDYPLTKAGQNATDLLKACHNLFDSNAFQHKRKSEQLKIEKELFPNCIQASVKYENKRKSTNLCYKNKENRYLAYFPGEEIYLKENKMENSVTYVQQWLNKNEKNLTRKPFSDLNVNTQLAIGNTILKQKFGDENVSLDHNRKRTHFKTRAKDCSGLDWEKKLVCESGRSPKKVKKKKYLHLSHVANSNTDIQTKCENDESGIFMEHDPIVIDDSQESVVDKDTNAWLAVLKACENEELQSTSINNASQDSSTNENNKLKDDVNITVTKTCVLKVPFYKKSAIFETCRYCKDELISDESVPDLSQINPVKITIDNENFLTTITVFKNVQNNTVMNTTSNVSVQTNICKTDALATHCHDIELKDENIQESKLVDNKSVSGSSKHSVDLFANDKKIFATIYPKTEVNKCVVIEESDSDTDIDASGPISVTADVHRSYEELQSETLNKVVNLKEHEIKPRRGPRGHTPTSTDSSEKENYNPNRMKKNNTGKKKNKKVTKI